MQNIQIFSYNNSQIEFEVINGEVFANATVMCQAFNKMPYAFLRLESTNRYLEALREKNATEYIITKTGGANQGTWIHEKLILRLSAWLNVDFEVWCDERIAELMKTGKVELKPLQLPNFLDPAEAAIAWATEYKAKQLAELKVVEMQPKVSAFDRVIDNSTTYTLDTVSDILNYGRTKLSEKLKEIGWAMKDSRQGTSSTRKSEESGYARTFFETVNRGEKEFKVKKIVVTKKGLDYLIHNFNELSLT